MIERALFSKLGKIRRLHGEPLMHVITLRGPFMVNSKLAIRDEPNIRLRCSRNVKHSLVLPMKKHEADDEPPPSLLPPVCPFNTSPCMPAPRAHVFQHVRVVPVHKGTSWTDTRGRFGRTHTHHTPHTTPHPKTQHTTHNTQHDHNTTTTQQQQKQQQQLTTNN